MTDEQAYALMTLLSDYIKERAPNELHITIIIADPKDNKLNMLTNNCIVCAYEALDDFIQEEHPNHLHPMPDNEPKWKM